MKYLLNIFFIIYLNFSYLNSYSNTTNPPDSTNNLISDTLYVACDSSVLENLMINIENNNINSLKSNLPFLSTEKKNRGTAIILAILTGPLGGHRLYLGTKPYVPVVYACTLGCLGILAFIDIVVLCFSKDISRFENNDKIIMWAN